MRTQGGEFRSATVRPVEPDVAPTPPTTGEAPHSIARPPELAEIANLYCEHFESFFGFAMALYRDREEAKSVAGEAFARTAHKHLQGLVDDFHNYGMSAVANMRRGHLRKLLRSPREAPLGDLVDNVSDAGVDVESVAIDWADCSYDVRLVSRLVNGLGKQQRAVVHLFYFEQMSYSEISQVLGMNVKTVSSTLDGARKLLRKRAGVDGA